MRTRKKRILFMAQLPPPVHGAALRNKSLLESKVINDQFEISSLPLRFVDDLKEIGSFSFKKVLVAIGFCFKLFFILVTKKIDLAYFTMSPKGGAFYRDVLFITILKVFRKKVLLHFRVKGIQTTASSGTGRRLVRYAFRGSDIVCLSMHQLEDMKGFLTKPPYIVPNGIQVEKYRFETKDPCSEPGPGKQLHILFLSNLMRTKGIYELVESLEMLRKRNFNFEVAIAGKEFDISYAELNGLLREKQLEDFVKVIGPVYGEEKFKTIAAADIFVFPTYFELFPGVVLEAMQYGRPIISTFEGSIPEMIDQEVNGMLVPPKDPVALADAMENLLSDCAKRERLGAAAKEKFFKEFTLEKFEENMKSVFIDVINK